MLTDWFMIVVVIILFFVRTRPPLDRRQNEKKREIGAIFDAEMARESGAAEKIQNSHLTRNIYPKYTNNK